MDTVKDVAEKIEIVSHFVTVVGWGIIVVLICWYILREGGPSINITQRDQQGVISSWFNTGVPAGATPVIIAPTAAAAVAAAKEGFNVLIYQNA
jgi:hypothetical protein